MSTRDIITVIVDPAHVLGKQFAIDKVTGDVTKSPEVHMSAGIATQHHVPDVMALERLLTIVSENNNAAITNACFPLIPVGEPFLLLSEKMFKGKFGIDRRDPSQEWPAQIKLETQTWPALGRFTEHTAPSTWQLLDRDVDEHTPPQFSDLGYEGWLAEIEKLMPGFMSCARLHVQSSSARVLVDGSPVGKGNGHTWFQVADPDDIERFRKAIKLRAMALEMAWKKPRKSKTTGETIGNGIAGIVDWTVFTPGRLVFAGKPEVNA